MDRGDRFSNLACRQVKRLALRSIQAQGIGQHIDCDRQRTPLVGFQIDRRDVQLHGLCLYPILGMPEWHEPDVIVRLGLWDLEPGDSGLERNPDAELLGALREEMRRWPAHPQARVRLSARPIPYP